MPAHRLVALRRRRRRPRRKWTAAERKVKHGLSRPAGSAADTTYCPDDGRFAPKHTTKHGPCTQGRSTCTRNQGAPATGPAAESVRSPCWHSEENQWDGALVANFRVLFSAARLHMLFNSVGYRRRCHASLACHNRVNHATRLTACQFLCYTAARVCIVTSGVVFVHFVAVEAQGSGIPEMRTILNGFDWNGGLGSDCLHVRTLVAKVVGLTLALGGGLRVGKEGPFVHISCILAYQMLTSFQGHFRAIRVVDFRTALSAACAVGVASFGAPVGGVLFSMRSRRHSTRVQCIGKRSCVPSRVAWCSGTWIRRH